VDSSTGGLKSLLVLLPGVFNRFGTLLGRTVARGDIGTDVIEDSPSVGSQYLVHGTLEQFDRSICCAISFSNGS